ncbi:MAG: hypothetical protein K4571_14865 [Deltaproteobacteria bacterium]
MMNCLKAMVVWMVLQILLSSSLIVADADADNVVYINNVTPFTLTANAKCIECGIFGWGNESDCWDANPVSKTLDSFKTGYVKCVPSTGHKFFVKEVTITSSVDKTCTFQTPANSDSTWYVTLSLDKSHFNCGKK